MSSESKEIIHAADQTIGAAVESRQNVGSLGGANGGDNRNAAGGGGRNIFGNQYYPAGAGGRNAVGNQYQAVSGDRNAAGNGGQTSFGNQGLDSVNHPKWVPIKRMQQFCPFGVLICGACEILEREKKISDLEYVLYQQNKELEEVKKECPECLALQKRCARKDIETRIANERTQQISNELKAMKQKKEKVELERDEMDKMVESHSEESNKATTARALSYHQWVIESSLQQNPECNNLPCLEKKAALIMECSDLKEDLDFARRWADVVEERSREVKSDMQEKVVLLRQQVRYQWGRAEYVEWRLKQAEKRHRKEIEELKLQLELLKSKEEVVRDLETDAA